ncbi:hypothetical protein J0895_10285 [Phormidium pseudopriestleyi FRX01]|uniref:Uncharacterized protein n=1 Tax=Phormidium pseudopriestleyi FRX01 TaxID=1759528 RepID=A0ABS3FQT8_9CYAN|nr:hypothetical protein [Phormidium pseudopriestleyi]MBO0349489.1 hypothetical protein [Phormidium pseudopriestleyi FRX01]
MKDYQRYFRIVLSVILMQVLTISGFNIAVDPYSVFNNPIWVGFNQVKPEKDKQVRMFKAIDIIRIQPNMVFIGSSRTEFGLDPAHPALAEVQPAYNLGITGANIYEARRYFEHAIANNPELKQAAIGVDFFMFGQDKKNQDDFSEDRLLTSHITPQDKFNSIFSLGAIRGSLKTIRANQSSVNRVGYFYPDGRRNTDYYVSHIYGGLQGVDIMGDLLRENDFFQSKKQGNPYEISHLEEVKNIVKLCQKKNIKCDFFISPSHVTHWESIRLSGAWQLFEEWKRDLAQIAPVWDFSGYNSITTDPLSSNMKNYIDSSHYRKEIGDLVLNRIWQYNEDIVPKDFGVLLTPETVENHLKQIRENRKIWANNHPDVVEFVENVLNN